MNNEVKRWTILKVADDEFYLDDGERPDCEYSEIKVMRVEDHERIVAKKDGELLTYHRMAASGVWIESKEYDDILKTIASQKRIIDKLTVQRNALVVFPELKYTIEELDEQIERMT